MQKNLGGVVMIAIGVAVMIVAIKGDLSSFVAQGKAIASPQKARSTDETGASAPAVGTDNSGLAPGSPGSGVTTQ